MAPWRRHSVPRSPNDCADPSMMRRYAMSWGRGHTPRLGTCCSSGLRLGGNPRCLVATTPRPTKLIRELLAREGRDVAVTRGSTYENRANLAAGFFDQVIRKYEGTRLGRQELNAELLEDTPGALWSHGIIDAARQAAAPNLARIVVAIDPAASSGEDADETGIVIVGRDNQGHGYVLADASGKHQPIEWAKIAIAAYRAHHADRIVAERNNGGAMVEATIRMVDNNLPVTTVWASHGKVARAEPVSALYEQGRVHHIGTFPASSRWKPVPARTTGRVKSLSWAIMCA